jgi:hypothetical protein
MMLEVVGHPNAGGPLDRITALARSNAIRKFSAFDLNIWLSTRYTDSAVRAA